MFSSEARVLLLELCFSLSLPKTNAGQWDVFSFGHVDDERPQQTAARHGVLIVSVVDGQHVGQKESRTEVARCEHIPNRADGTG